MAQIIKKTSALEKEYSEYKTIRNVAFGASIVCLCLLPLSSIFAPFLPIVTLFIPLLIPVILGGAVAGLVMHNNVRRLQSGIEGETATAQIIASLPDQYWGFQNLNVAYDGKVSEMDMVVVGPTGVFVIETKNMNGSIVGSYDNPQWVQHKVGQGGTPYSKNFYSPVKQVGTHVYRLANYLRSHGCRVHVDAMVYFSNPGTAVQVMGVPTAVPVFSAIADGAQEIYNHILSNNRVLSDDVINRIHALLIGDGKGI